MSRSPSLPDPSPGMSRSGPGPVWPWALGVVITAVRVDRRRCRELRLTVAVEAYKLGYFLVDVLTVNAVEAAVGLDDVRVTASRTTVDTVLLLDTCRGDHLLDRALPGHLAVYPLAAPGPEGYGDDAAPRTERMRSDCGMLDLATVKWPD